MLSFRQESEITSTLAFLSGISNDSSHITAVSLEELPAEGGCKILLAINKLKPTCGQEILDKVQRGFEQIFKRLRNISPSMSHHPHQNKKKENLAWPASWREGCQAALLAIWLTL